MTSLTLARPPLTPGPWTQEDRPPRGPRFDPLSLVPLIAIVALVAGVGALVWVVNRGEEEQARVKLATDALWVEQTLRFQLGIHEDMLVRLALEAAGGAPAATLDARTRLHIANNPELLSVAWHDATGRLRRALPGGHTPGDPALAALLSGRAAQTSRIVYGAISETGLVSLGLPLGDGTGSLMATMSLPLLLERHIPWWIAEQYGVRLLDARERALAERQRLKPPPGAPSHLISFDPPLHGTALRITAYVTPTGFRVVLLLGTIAALAVFAILALYVLFRTAERRRMAELRLRGEIAFRRSMEESLTVGLRAKDHAGRILYVNAAFCNLVGWNAEDLVGRMAPMPYWDPQRLDETQTRQRQLAAGGAVGQSFETRFRHRDGHLIEVQVFEAPLIDARGTHQGWMGSVIDITEAKRAARRARAQDEALARTGRLVMLGEMASTLAHELNQPLSAIASYAAGMLNLMHHGSADPALLQEVTGKLAKQAGRAGQIIHHIQDLVKKREPRFAPTRLDDVVLETVGFLAADAREHRIRLLATVSPLPPVHADRILLEQVLINLIRNGMEAMSERRSGDAVIIRLMAEDTQAIIEVADQGSGIPPDIAERLFDAFATTKPQGMGMGLKICRTLVELHRGQLSHYPAEGGGTVFRVALPFPDILDTAPGSAA
ncbi:sensor histidine kinase [Pararhodospirillum photometricum]|uniref:sensor histidine kinase n=1 Tax=Pararhodospirillum photometricum TaxID=1084 RepID=UPI00030B328E|nr:PAS domain S-box protein [Pararhodospirillum photometricum]